MRICMVCGVEYQDFGQQMRRCRPCINEYLRASWERRSQNPEWKANRKAVVRGRRVRNSIVISEFLKSCRCSNCRENNPRCLRFWDSESRHIKLDKVKHGLLTLKKLAEITKDAQCLCLNCRAATEGRIHMSIVLAA